MYMQSSIWRCFRCARPRHVYIYRGALDQSGCINVGCFSLATVVISYCIADQYLFSITLKHWYVDIHVYSMIKAVPSIYSTCTSYYWKWLQMIIDCDKTVIFIMGSMLKNMIPNMCSKNVSKIQFTQFIH